jgi:hypothetical protein
MRGLCGAFYRPGDQCVGLHAFASTLRRADKGAYWPGGARGWPACGAGGPDVVRSWDETRGDAGSEAALGRRAALGCAGGVTSEGGPDVESGGATRTRRTRAGAAGVMVGATSLVPTHLPLFDRY